ncbi:MAG: orotate phosphoribosyltransferase [Bacillota bacterium]
MLSKEEILNIFQKTGVLKEGHFLLSSGLHADKYLQCASVLKYPQYAHRIGVSIAELWADREIDVVVGPALGGILVSYIVAQSLSVRSIFTERKQGEMKLRRNFKLDRRERVLVVEDVVTTGGSVHEALKVIEEYDVEIVGISPIVDRSGGQAGFDYDYQPLIELEVESYPAANCPLCKKGIPLTKPGSRKEI